MCCFPHIEKQLDRGCIQPLFIKKGPVVAGPFFIYLIKVTVPFRTCRFPFTNSTLAFHA
jgi:hypothetical protein